MTTEREALIAARPSETELIRIPGDDETHIVSRSDPDRAICGHRRHRPPRPHDMSLVTCVMCRDLFEGPLDV
jgi:hypothetical protein